MNLKKSQFFSPSKKRRKEDLTQKINVGLFFRSGQTFPSALLKVLLEIWSFGRRGPQKRKFSAILFRL